LAEIDAPELDRQVSQARAALQQSQQQVNERRADVADARAQLELARITWERYRELAARGAIPQQDGDQQFAAFKRATASVSRADAAVESARSNVQANQANLDRLASLQQYERLLAPFTGIITARNFDLGALVSSSGASQGNPATAPGTSGGASTELFRMAQINVLRILLNVPQENAPSIRIGMPATVLVEEFHGKRFEGKVSRTANTLDMNARTMLTEVQIRNPDQSLLPGMYAQIELLTRNGNEAVLVPGDSIVADSRGILVAVVREFQNTQSPQSDTNNGVAPQSRRNELKRVHLQKVQVGYDYGSEVEITAGLHAGELVVVNPNDDVEEGVIVQPVLARHRDAAGGQSENGRGGAQ
jgi:multidrug efflux pump subunit AcrA (membrane-fusion protein)